MVLPDFTIQNLILAPNPVAVGETYHVEVTVFDYLEPIWWQLGELQAGEV